MVRTPPPIIPALLLATALGPLAGCRGGQRSSASSPTAAPQSVALPGSDTAADAAQAPAVAEAAASNTTSYSDPETGVSFRYPSTWRPWHTGSTMYQPGLVQAAGSARITQVFDPQGTAWAKTNLVGLSFSYVVKEGLNTAACTQLAVESTSGGRPATPEAFNGITFQRAEGGDAGMCHQMSSVVDTALHNGRCYVFERDLETLCPEVRGPGNPVALTAAQLSTLRAELDRVMGSVLLH